MQVSLSKYYPFKVWATILIISPVLAVVWNAIAEPWDFNSDAIIIPIFLFFGGAFVSLPAFGIFFLSYKQLPKLVTSEIVVKILLIIICLLITGLTIYFLVDKVLIQQSNRDGFRVFLSYLIVVPISVFIFKLYK